MSQSALKENDAMEEEETSNQESVPIPEEEDSSIRSTEQLEKIAKGFLLQQSNPQKLYKYLEDNKMFGSLKEIRVMMTQFLSSLNFDSLFKFVQLYFSSCRQETVPLLPMIGNGNAQSLANSNLSRERTFIIKSLISWMFEGRIDGKAVKNGIGTIYEELDYIPDAMLASLLQTIYKLFKEGSCSIDEVSPLVGSVGFESLENSSSLVLDVWSQCISTLMSKDEIEINTKTKKKKKSEEYKTMVIQDMCRCDWSLRVLAFANTFKDMPLNEAELDMVLEKLLGYLHKMSMNDSPPLIYQLLLLSSRGKKQKILLGILSYFENLEKEKRRNSLSSEESLNQLEGTVLHFIDYATKQNQDLASEMMKIMKSESFETINTFKISFLLIISSLQTFEEKVFKLLKSMVDEDYKNSTTLHIYLDEQDISLLGSNSNCSRIILDTVKKCSKGRDFMIKSVVDFACYLLDNNKKAVTKTTEETSSLVPKKSSGTRMNPWELGLEILNKVFEVNTIVRPDILSRIFNRVVTNYGNTEKYIELLERIAYNQTSFLMDHVSKLKETIEYLSTMSFETSTALLSSLQPLYKSSQEFQDQVVLVLRKSMYSRESDARLIALTGFLQILQSTGDLDVPLATTGSSSGSSSSSSSNTLATRGSVIDLEIIGFLRRCLSQQMIIRKTLYKGLFNVVKLKPNLVNEITPIILEHLRKYLSEDDEKVNQIFFDSCVDTKSMSVTEPLADNLLLLANLCNITDDKDCYNLLLSVLAFIHDKDLESLEIDKPFDESTNDGKKNKLIAGIYVGCVEVMLQFAVINVACDPDNEQEAINILNTLWTNYLKVSENLSKKSSAKKKSSAGEKVDISQLVPDLDVAFCISALNLSINAIKKAAGGKSKEEGALLDSKFYVYILKMIMKKVKDQKKEKQKASRNSLLSLSGSLYKFLILSGNKASSSNDDSKKKDKVSSLAEEVFEELIKISNHNSNVTDIIEFFEGLVSVGKEKRKSSASNDMRISAIMCTLQKNIDSVIKQKAYGVASSLVHMVTSLLYLLEQKREILQEEKHYQWISDICQGSEFGDMELGKALIQHLILIVCMFADVNKLQELSSDVLAKVGHIEDTSERSVSNLLVINCPSESADVIASCLETILDDLDWKFQRIQALKQSLGNKYEEVRSDTFQQVTQIVDTMENMACSRLDLEISHKLFLPLIKFYTLVAKFTESYLSQPKDTDTELPEEFILLVNRLGEFTDWCYAFINYHNDSEKASTMKIVREVKNVPELIYRMETSEQQLILLSKNKVVNLLKNFKRSQVRAFTIDNKKVMEEVEENRKKKKVKKEDDDEEEEDQPQEEEEEETSKKKKRKNASSSGGSASKKTKKKK